MLYVHIPFCRDLCPFCSFHRVKFDDVTAHRYFDALESELEFHSRTGASYRDVYIGGGTPTVLPKRLVSLIESLYRKWPIQSVSVEMNPDALDREVLGLLADSGISRASVGVQSFSDRLLKSMNRFDKYGSGNDIVKRFENAADKFETLNVDLIFNMPGQSDEMIESDAKIATSLPVDQLTWYPIMPAEPATNRHSSREWRQFRLVNTLLEDSFSRSSVWCFSRGTESLDEYVIDSHDYAGAGSGAFGLQNGVLYANSFSIRDYCEGVIRMGVPPTTMIRRYTPFERSLYRILMDFFSAQVTGNSGAGTEFYRKVVSSIARGGASIGLGKLDRGEVEVGLLGRYWLLVLMREFFTGVNALRRTCRDLSAQSVVPGV